MRFKYQPKELLIPKVFLRGRREQKQYTISEWQSPVEAVASTSARMRQRRLPAAGFTKRAAQPDPHSQVLRRAQSLKREEEGIWKDYFLDSLSRLVQSNESRIVV